MTMRSASVLDARGPGSSPRLRPPHPTALTHPLGHRALSVSEFPSLLGMAVNYKAGWDGHDARQNCAITPSAHLDGKRLMVSGFLFARDFPEMERKMCGVGANADGDMGMSYELADAQVADMRAQIG